VTISTVAPMMMAVFNNLVMFDQHVPQNTLQSIVPDLATGWSWNEDGTALTLRLREGVHWHDGHPFTATAPTTSTIVEAPSRAGGIIPDGPPSSQNQCSTDPGLIAGTWHRPLFLTRDR
jgi:extracellular solute-binding protein (family 5)